MAICLELQIFIVSLCLAYVALPVKPAKSPEETCKQHFTAGRAPTNLNVFKAVGTCHSKDSETFFYNVYDEGVLHGSITAHFINHLLLNNCTRRRAFREDPQLQEMGIKQISPENPSSGYGPGWNRGHLGPNQVFSFDKSVGGAWDQCYYADNIAPQDNLFNQVGWKLLEANVFHYSKTQKKNLWVVTGTPYNSALGKQKTSPFDDPNVRRLKSGIGIPDYYYKVICDGEHSAAFAGKNLENHTGMESLDFMSVEQWQKTTGINFELSPSCNPSKVDPRHWNFTHAAAALHEDMFGPFILSESDIHRLVKVSPS